MEDSYVVIKVKHGDTLRRFNACIINNELDLSFDGLRKKIVSFFNFLPDSELMLTYTDEDGDIVTLADDDDLRDAVKQDMNPLRITVKLKPEKHGKWSDPSSGCSTPLVSPQVQQPQNYLNSGIYDTLRSALEALYETLPNHSTDLIAKASSSPVVAEIVDLLSGLCLSYMGQLSVAQPKERSSMHASVSECNSKVASKTKYSVDPDLTNGLRALLKVGSKEQSPAIIQSLEKLKPEGIVENNEVKSDDVTGDSSKGSSSKACNYNTVDAALDPPGAEVSLQSSTLTHPKPNLISGSVCKKGNGKDENVCKMTEDHVSMKHPMELHLLPAKHWHAEKFGKAPLTTSNLSSGASSSATEKKINNVNDYELTPNPVPNTFSSTQNGLSVPLEPAYRPYPDVRSNGFSGDAGDIIHYGVCCDGCGVHPIRGPRFNSKVEVDYDLCNICFQQIGNSTDYIRIDRPIAYPAQVQNSPQVYMGSKPKPADSKLDSQFVLDLTVFDGTVMDPLVPFTKIWRVRNNGTVPWPQKTQFVWVGGDKLSDVLSIELNFPAACLNVGHELDVAVDFITPELPGRYVSSWKLASPSGQHFGTCLWVLIEVDASLRKTPKEGDCGLNLNLSPEITVNSETMVQNEQFKLSSSKFVERTEVGLQQNAEHELKFPTNDTVLAGKRASNFIPYDGLYDSDPSFDCTSCSATHDEQPQSPFITTTCSNRASNSIPNNGSYVSDPFFDFPTPLFTSSASGSAVETPVKDNLENKLLKQLNEMGFNHVELNKEILKSTEYDLELTLDVLI